MSAKSKNPWLKGGCVAGFVFLAIELVGAIIGWFVGIGFMHGRITGLDGAEVCAVISLIAAVPISLLVGAITVVMSSKR